MVERVILIVAAILVGLLFIFALTSDRPKETGSASIDAVSINTGVDVADYSFAPPEDAWFQENVIDQLGAVIVDFKAEWCGPCKLLHPHLEKLEAKYHDRLTLVQVDVDEKRNLAQHYNVKAMPTVLLFVDGQVVEGFVGYLGFSELEAIFKSHIEASAPNTAAVLQQDANSATVLVGQLAN